MGVLPEYIVRVKVALFDFEIERGVAQIIFLAVGRQVDERYLNNVAARRRRRVDRLFIVYNRIIGYNEIGVGNTGGIGIIENIRYSRIRIAVILNLSRACRICRKLDVGCNGIVKI